MRHRDFGVKTTNKLNMFEGLPYIQYDQFLRQDPLMQNVIFRDLLKILLDKCNGLKNLINERGKLSKVLLFFLLIISITKYLLKIYKRINHKQITAYNIKIEELLGMTNIICIIILQGLYQYSQI